MNAPEHKRLHWPLMDHNVTRQDRLAASNFFLEGGTYDLADNKLTNGPQVAKFEEEFSAWLGVKYSVMVNSGASANLITMQALKILHDVQTVAVPCITWVSDIAAVLHAGLEPVFVDVDQFTLGMDVRSIPDVDAIFITHCLGFAALDGMIMPGIHKRGDKFVEPYLIEDVCEAIGAKVVGRKLGTLGLMSNFSFYYGHHMTTIEGGMVCTDDYQCYQWLRMLRSHGLVREMAADCPYKEVLASEYPDLDPEFIFRYPAYNVRPTEINGVLGRAQLKRLDANNKARDQNLRLWLSLLDPARYRIRYHIHGASNFALPLVLQADDSGLFQKVLACLREYGVEFRKGTAGGGNQLRQPYARERWGDLYKEFPNAEHIHNFGLYVGNYPQLPEDNIHALVEALNKV